MRRWVLLLLALLALAGSLPAGASNLAVQGQGPAPTDEVKGLGGGR